MIVEPDFFDHWKTRLLIELSHDKASPIWVLRLWGHCQQRKKWRFKGLDYSALRAVCGATEIDGGVLWELLKESGFLRVEGDTWVVHDWEKSNRSLISAWKNGSKGGRPLKSLENRQVTDRKPVGNRQTTHPSILSISNLSSVQEGGTRGKELCSQKEAEDYCASIGLPRSDGTAMFLHWTEKGWAKVKDWKLTIQKWRSFGYLPSQKTKGGFTKTDQHHQNERQSRLDAEMAEARQKYGKTSAS